MLLWPCRGIKDLIHETMHMETLNIPYLKQMVFNLQDSFYIIYPKKASSYIFLLTVKIQSPYY